MIPKALRRPKGDTRLFCELPRKQAIVVDANNHVQACFSFAEDAKEFCATRPAYEHSQVYVLLSVLDRSRRKKVKNSP